MAALRFTLRQMEVFSAVARSGSTSSAAEEISLSQSAVSASLNDLEVTLGVQLFDRMGRKLILNAMGRALVLRAAELVDGARGIEMDFQSANPLSHLRIAASTTIGNYLIPKMLAQHSLAEPLGRVDVHVGNTSDVLRLVSDFSVDAGVIEGPASVPGVVLHHWRDDELVIVAAPLHPLVAVQRSTGKALDRRTLENATWLVREEGSGTRNAVQGALLPHLGPIRQSRVLGSSEAIKRAVILGLGISCLSRILIDEHLKDGQLVELDTELPALTRAFHVAIHRERRLNAALERFFQRRFVPAPVLETCVA